MRQQKVIDAINALTSAAADVVSTDQIYTDAIYFLRYLSRVKNILETQKEWEKYAEDLNTLFLFFRNQETVQDDTIRKIISFYYTLLVKRRLEKFRIFGRSIYQKFDDENLKLYFEKDFETVFSSILRINHHHEYRSPLIEYIDELCEDAENAKKDGLMWFDRRFWGGNSGSHPRARQLHNIENIRDIYYLKSKKIEMGDEKFAKFLENWIKEECLSLCFGEKQVDNSKLKKQSLMKLHPALISGAVRRMQEWTDIAMEVGCDRGLAEIILKALDQPELVLIHDCCVRPTGVFRPEYIELKEAKDKVQKSLSRDYLEDFEQKTQAKISKTDQEETKTAGEKKREIRQFQHDIMVNTLVTVGRDLKEENLTDLLRNLDQEEIVPRILIKLKQIYVENNCHANGREIGVRKMIFLLSPYLKNFSVQQLKNIATFFKEKYIFIEGGFEVGNDFSDLAITSWDMVGIVANRRITILEAKEPDILKEYRDITNCIRECSIQTEEKIKRITAKKPFFDFSQRRNLDQKAMNGLMMSAEYLQWLDSMTTKNHNPQTIIDCLVQILQGKKTEAQLILVKKLSSFYSCDSDDVHMDLILLKEKLEHLRITEVDGYKRGSVDLDEEKHRDGQTWELHRT
jgi:hypothetical protein